LVDEVPDQDGSHQADDGSRNTSNQIRERRPFQATVQTSETAQEIWDYQVAKDDPLNCGQSLYHQVPTAFWPGLGQAIAEGQTSDGAKEQAQASG
jgi:hypothetical protein